MTGYLTQRGRADGNLYNLVIPNREIRNIFTEQIMKCSRNRRSRTVIWRQSARKP